MGTRTPVSDLSVMAPQTMEGMVGGAMKGFGIYVKNDLLEPKHHNQMGVALWLYLWLLDKMTSISEDGIGKVLGGKPIKYEEVFRDLGVSRRTYGRYVEALEVASYITTKRTPYGLIIEVHKASKIFGKRSARNGTSNTPHVAHHYGGNGTSVGGNGTSNKTIQLDNTNTIQGEPAILGAGYAQAKATAQAIKAKN